MAVSDRPRWSRIPPEVAGDRNLSAEAKIVYGALWDRSDAEGWCFPTLGRLAGDVGRGTTAVKRAVAELVAAKWVDRKAAWRLHNDTGEVFYEPGPGRVKTANRYRVLGKGVEVVGGPKVGVVGGPKGVGTGVGTGVGVVGGPRSNYRKKELQKEVIPSSAVSANSNRPTTRAEEEATLDTVIAAVRERRSPPLSRDQAREARKIARDRLRAGWAVERIVGVLVETTAFTSAAVDFAASGSGRRRGSSAAERSQEVLERRIRGGS
jgi:hypothetical protein